MGQVGASDRGLRGVACSMAAGAAYDALFALAILAFHETAAGWIGLVPPPDPVYLRLNGVLLLLLAALYTLPARWPARYRGVAALAAAGRLGGSLFLAAAWWGGRPVAFAWLALGDLAFGLWHAAALARARSASSGATP